MNKLTRKNRAHLGMILLALGIATVTTLESVRAVGIVFILIGDSLVVVRLLGWDEK